MDFSITLLSPDKELVDEVWSFASDEVSVEGLMAKSMLPTGFLHEVSAYAKDAAPLIVFLGALLNLVKSPKNKSPAETTINIQCAENSTNVIQFIEANKGEINVKINDNGG
jgi:hypothetical protein